MAYIVETKYVCYDHGTFIISAYHHPKYGANCYVCGAMMERIKMEVVEGDPLEDL